MFQLITVAAATAARVYLLPALVLFGSVETLSQVTVIISVGGCSGRLLRRRTDGLRLRPVLALTVPIAVAVGVGLAVVGTRRRVRGKTAAATTAAAVVVRRAPVALGGPEAVVHVVGRPAKSC